MKRRGRPNTTGVPGVQQPGRRGGFRVRFLWEGETVDLGRFATVAQAEAALKIARTALARGVDPRIEVEKLRIALDALGYCPEYYQGRDDE